MALEGDFNYDEIPPFAKLSPTNVWLAQQIKLVERELRDVQAQNEDAAGRNNVMREHLKNVQAEVLHTQQLFDSKRKEIGMHTIS